MIFCFSGTGNSRYIAQRIAEALQKTVIDLNARIKDNDTATVDTGSDVIMVTPTYAWRIPKIVSEWMAKTKWTAWQNKNSFTIWEQHRLLCRRIISPCSMHLRWMRHSRLRQKRNLIFRQQSNVFRRSRNFLYRGTICMTV